MGFCGNRRAVLNQKDLLIDVAQSIVLLTDELCEAADVINNNAETNRRMRDEIGKAGEIFSRLSK